MLKLLSCAGLFLLLIGSLRAQVELGAVDWMRDYPAALEAARTSDKDILLLFQEVPGCHTCRRYGEQVLSDPRVLGLIDAGFIPLAIFNNKGGADAKVLAQYQEPAWNNPVVRIIDAEGTDRVPRLARAYDAESLLGRMALARRSALRPLSPYEEIMYQELSHPMRDTAYYQMYCFWSGEAHFGSHPAVLATEAAWMKGREVVRVIYDPDLVSSAALDSYAAQADCQLIEEDSSYKTDRAPQYYLRHSPYHQLVGLSPLQRSRINAALARGTDPSIYLSPRQAEALK